MKIRISMKAKAALDMAQIRSNKLVDAQLQRNAA